MSAQPLPKLTFDEYLEIEREADFRSEFIDGEIFAMSGGSHNHAHIIMAAGAQLYAQLRGAPCSVVSSDMRVKTNRMGTYPDLVVTCGPDRLYDKRRDTLTDATVIIEVLSPSTKRFDQGEKFEFYRSLPSFREYVLLWQDSIRAEHYVRLADGDWKLHELAGAGCVIELISIGCKLELGSLYERVAFDSE